MRLYRSNRDKKVFGLCGGLAESFKIDATILRLIVIIGIPLSGGAVLLLYLLAALVIPKESDLHHGPYNAGGQYGGWQYGQTSGHTSHTSSGMQQGHYNNQTQAGQTQSTGNPIDDMMKDIEKKALLKEIEELKARLAKVEKNEKGDE